MDHLTPLIAPSFLPLHRQIVKDTFSHYWLKGGRGSTKSSFISIEIILGIMRDPNANGAVLRKVGATIRDSVFEQLQWAITHLGVADLWEPKVSPLSLVYLPTGQKIIFRGADNPKKIKSAKVSQGYIRYIWYEEVDEFYGMDELRIINQSLMRGGNKFDVFYSYNPPKNASHWINGEVALQSIRQDTLIHHSDFRAVPSTWLGEQFVAEAEHLRRVSPQLYQHEYLGEITGTGGEVFINLSLREISDAEIVEFDRVRRGIDWGYGSDPFVYLAAQVDVSKRIILINLQCLTLNSLV
ncbi:MAG: PBSX family phage terminase large subunit, partial [Oscillospiraceae bacterium]